MTTNTKPARMGAPPRYPWEAMRKGDSFLLPADKCPAGGAPSVYKAGYRWANDHASRRGTKFFATEVPEGVRAWCVARPDSVPLSPLPESAALKIEQGVPLPVEAVRKYGARVGAALEYPDLGLDGLGVGDSITVHWANPRALRMAIYEWTAADSSRRARRFVVRETFGGYAVERVA
jgi:hypothetical protein